MRTWFRALWQAPREGTPALPAPTRLALTRLEERTVLDAGVGFMQTALASDIPGVAAHTDPNLINPWGFTETPQGQFRVAANGSGDALLVNAGGAVLGRPVVLPPPPGSPPGTTSTPNGAVANTTSDFVISAGGRTAPATTIFSTEDGTIIGWNPRVDRTHGVIASDQSAGGAVYKLLAMGSVGQNNFLYATDFHNNRIDVFDGTFTKVKLGTGGFGTFSDPNAPAGFAPFGVKNVGGVLFVTYAKQDDPADAHDDVAGAGNGFIDEFTTTGHLIRRFATGSNAGGTLDALNSPIGMAVAPKGFGPGGMFGGALLVGNFGDSHVSAFNILTGDFLGQLSDPSGHALTLNGGVGGNGTVGLWGIAFGNGHGGSDPNALYFASGVNDEADGVFGKVTMTDGDGDRDDGRMFAFPGRHDDTGTSSAASGNTARDDSRDGGKGQDGVGQLPPFAGGESSGLAGTHGEHSSHQSGWAEVESALFAGIRVG